MALVLVVEDHESFSDALSYRLRERSDVPLIMMSARDTALDKAVWLQLGADDYVTKPFTWHDLAARIQAVLPGSAGESQEVPA